MAKDPHAAAMGRKRWTQTGDDPAAVGALGGAAARGKSGRKPVPTPCPTCNAPCGSIRDAKAHCKVNKP